MSVLLQSREGIDSPRYTVENAGAPLDQSAEESQHGTFPAQGVGMAGVTWNRDTVVAEESVFNRHQHDGMGSEVRSSAAA